MTLAEIIDRLFGYPIFKKEKKLSEAEIEAAIRNIIAQSTRRSPRPER